MILSGEFVTIDGARGEGGGQIVRSALGLAMVQGQAIRLVNIRAGRSRPGLLRQHLTAVRAAAKISHAQVTGDRIGSTEVTFEPGAIQGGRYEFSIGSAGSCMLVLQTLLPALLQTQQPSEVILEGGTHNPFAPPFEFLKHVFARQLTKMGVTLVMQLARPGYYPAGGGKATVQITPVARLQPLELVERGALRRIRAMAVVSRLPVAIADRELTQIAAAFHLADDDLQRVEEQRSLGPGNVVMMEVEHEHVTEVFTGFGQKGVSAEHVAEQVIAEARAYLKSSAPVGPYLADQLLIPLALAGGGVFRTSELTPHTTTNIATIGQLLPIRIEQQRLGRDLYEIHVRDVG